MTTMGQVQITNPTTSDTTYGGQAILAGPFSNMVIQNISRFPVMIFTAVSGGSTQDISDLNFSNADGPAPGWVLMPGETSPVMNMTSTTDYVYGMVVGAAYNDVAITAIVQYYSDLA